MSKKKSKKDIKAERKMLVSVINKQKKTEEKRKYFGSSYASKSIGLGLRN